MSTPDTRPPFVSAELVAAIRAGDEAAFETLFRAYWAPLCAFAFRFVKQRDVAQDVVSDVFTRAWAERARWDVKTSVQAYLYAAVRRSALNVLRHDAVVARAAVDRDDVDASPGSAPPALTPEEQLVYDETVRAVTRAIEALPERTRLIATMRWYDRLSHAEIADVLGLPVRSVGNRLAYALTIIRAKLGRQA